MIQFETENGIVEFSHHFFNSLIGQTVSQCFGVLGMSTTGTLQTITSRLPFLPPTDQGVRLSTLGHKLVIDLHIIVSYGVNLSAISNSISNKVKYTVEEVTGLKVSKVNVYVDDISAESF